MPHVSTIVVRFADLDPYDHVNHARYLTYFESARIEMLEQMGFGMDVMKREGFQIVLVELTAGFHVPATLHDRLEIATTVGDLRRSTTTWTQRALRGTDLIASLAVKAAFTDRSGRPIRAPEGFAEAASRFADQAEC